MASNRKESGFERFPETRWSLVKRVGADTPVARRALEDICQSYWGPLYAFARRSGQSPSDAEDVTQDFVAQLLERETFAKIRQEGGRLRSFLLTSLRNFIRDRVRREAAVKRGGGKRPLSMDLDGVEETVAAHASDRDTPETAFEKQWALRMVEEAFARVETEYEESARGELFGCLHPCLQGEEPSGTYAEIGQKLGMSEGAVKVAAHRLRQRYRRCFELVVLETVESESEVEEELAFIQAALRG